MRCETKEELIAMVAREGVEVTPEEAEAYMAEMADLELDEELLMKELGHITETSTSEIKASISVIRNEIDQVLNERI